jgi:formylglycine-generating enzyme required for sulfatase activity
MLFRIFLLLLLPVSALAQDCDCCKIRTLGQQKYDAQDYAGAKSTWETAKKMNDAAKCPDLKDLIANAKKKIKPNPPPNKPTQNKAADELAWKYAQGTLLGCQRYLADYPQGIYVAEARQCEKDYSDSDEDGIINKNDACPNEKGLVADKGCPPPKPVVVTPPASSDAPIPSPVSHGKKSGLTMIPVAGGTYTMGSPATESNRSDDECQHSVTVDNFAMGQYEVTQADWQEVMGTDPSRFKGCGECPVEQVSWNDIQEFIKAANQKYGRNYRLPTEAEWEYAARGGKKSQGYLYSGGQTLNEVAWCSSNSDSHTHEVGTKKANELGLYDMSGNVWEWCSDEWAPYPGCSEPKEVERSVRVLRGGSWNYYDVYCRVAYRFRSNDSSRFNFLGFRLAQD